MNTIKDNMRISLKQYRVGKCYLFSIVILLILSLLSNTAADNSSVHSNLLYLHSYFKNKHWQRSGDTLDYSLPSSYTSLTPIKAFMAGNDSNNIALFSTSDKLYLMHAVIKPPPTITANSSLTVDDPVQSSVGLPDSVFGLFAYTADNLDILFLAMVAADKIAVHHMIGSSFNIFKTDTLTINLPDPNCRITKLYGGPHLTKGSQSCIWAVGTHGLIRLFSWDGSNWSSETGYDIDSQETVSAFSLGAVGTVSGKVYINQADSFVYDSQPVTKSINHISTDGGACNDGTILKKKGTQWSVFVKGNTHYSYFNFISRTDGSGVELLDDSWNYYIYTLEDTLTSFNIAPAQIAAHINSSPYIFTGFKPETVSVYLLDPDDNYLVPEITLNSSTLLTIDGTDTLKDIHPDTSCVSGLLELADDTITIILNANTIELFAKARKSEFNPVSFKYYWTYPTFHTSTSWSDLDQLTIKLGNQRLEIRVGGVTIISDSYNKMLNQSPVQYKNNQLVFTLPENEIHSISIFNIVGRKIASETISPQKSKLIMPIMISSGIIIIEYHFKNGTRKRHLLPVRE